MNTSVNGARRSIRLPRYDYTRDGAYFVTVCAMNRECLFGEVEVGKVVLSGYGRMVGEEWETTARVRTSVVLDEWVVMPNHFHGIVVIAGGASHGTALGHGTPGHGMPGHRTPLGHGTPCPYERFGAPVAGSLATIVRSFKAAASKRINESRNTVGVSVWQRNYYEHVIRGDDDLRQIREYIANNPLQWGLDRENPSRPRDRGI